jgi:hypothetical protein
MPYIEGDSVCLPFFFPCTTLTDVLTMPAVSHPGQCRKDEQRGSSDRRGPLGLANSPP